MDQDRGIPDLILGALLLSRYAQYPPAGEAACRALYRLIDRGLAPASKTAHGNFAERIEAWSVQGGISPEAKEELLSLHRELFSFFGPESRYVPGFIQKRIAAYVARVNELYRNSGGGDLETELKSLSPEDWGRLEATAGPAVAQVRLAMDAMTMRPEDFRDLSILRSKVQVWAPALLPALREKGYNFTLDSISRVNLTSGYIWVAFLTDPSRRKMEQPTYSLSFTPRHCRAGLELGGKTRAAREAYYKKFLSGELDDVFAEMASFGGVFADIVWYFSYRDTIPMRDYLENKDGVKKRIAEKLESGLKRLPGEVLYTWNILLPVVLITPEEFARETIDDSLVRLADPVVKLIRRIGG